MPVAIKCPSRFNPWANMLLGTHIAWLCAAVALPLLLFAAYGAYTAATNESAHLEDIARAEARDIALLVGRDLAETKATLNALSMSSALEADDLKAFYQRAHELLAIPGLNVVLRTPDGRQILNTRMRPGERLPESPNLLPIDIKAAQTRLPQVSDLFIGTLTQAPMYVVEQPIIRRDTVKYLLGISAPVQHLGQVLEGRPSIPGGWVTLIDGTGTILARTLSPETSVATPVQPQVTEAIARANPDSTTFMTSRDGIRIFAAFHRVGGTSWTAAVAVPEASLKAPLMRNMGWTAAIAGIAMTCSGALALAYRAYLQRQAARLSTAALALGKGDPVQWTQCRIRELDDVGGALQAAERELHRRLDERDKLLRALGQSPVILRDTEDRIAFWGKGAEELYGYSPAEALGQRSQDLLATEFPSALDHINVQLAELGRWEGVLFHHSKAGQRLMVKSTWALWRDPFTRQPIMVVETNSDMTAQAAKAAAEEADRAKTAFLGAISHDLRQPLQAVRLFQQVLEGQAGAPLATVVERMGRALTSAEEMLAAMSQLSVMETGALETIATTFPVGEVLCEIAEDCAATAASAGLKLRCVPSGVRIHTDRVLFKRMVRNLAMNAIRYTRTGGVLIGCRRQKGKLLVQVVDSGIGIPPAKLPQIFDAFFQVGDAPQNGTRGLGLGLAIVSRLSQTLRLPVGVASIRDKGSVFSITVDPAGKQSLG